MNYLIELLNDLYGHGNDSLNVIAHGNNPPKDVNDPSFGTKFGWYLILK